MLWEYRLKQKSTLIVAMCLMLSAPTFAGCGSEVLAAASDHSLGVFTNGAERIDEAIEAGPLAQRQQECVNEDGLWAEWVVVSECEQGQARVFIEGAYDSSQECDGGPGEAFEGMCTHRDPAGALYFNDGPTVPAAMIQFSEMLGASLDQTNYMSLFWSAGVAHDYCYHHNPITRGFTQAHCDRNFLSDLSAVCVQPTQGRPWFSKKGCQFYASALYGAVKAGGKPSYDLLNTLVDYPEWIPMWKQYGMQGEVIDEELKEQIDECAEQMPL